jgi:hypothetical protein
MLVRPFIERRGRVKKNKGRNKEQTNKPRRLKLSRETITVLNDPAFLAFAKGGAAVCSSCMGSDSSKPSDDVC